MNDEESLQPNTVSVEPPSNTPSKPQKASPYEMLMRQSRKMGNFATRGYDVTKEFLKSDVQRLHPDTILFKRRTGQLNETSTQAINNIVRKSHQVLAAAKTVPLPRNIFPDSVLLDRSKLTITKRTFFWSSETISIRIEDILNVTSGVGPFFGSITVSSRVMNSTDHYEIDCFWRRDVIYLKEIIQGYMIALHNNVPTDHMSRDELIKTLLALGRDSSL